MFKIIFYQDKHGESEVENYIKELRKNIGNKDNRVKLNKIVAYINQLFEQGLNLGNPYIKIEKAKRLIKDYKERND